MECLTLSALISKSMPWVGAAFQEWEWIPMFDAGSAIGKVLEVHYLSKRSEQTSQPALCSALAVSPSAFSAAAFV